jgi:hypothetical protein
MDKTDLSPNYNQRTYTRIDVDFPVSVTPDDAASFEATVLDISAGGLRVEYAHQPVPGTAVTCNFFGSAHSLIEVRGLVCSGDRTSFGIRLTGYDAVSYAHLKALLLRLADDPHALENEILLNLDSLPEAD